MSGVSFIGREAELDRIKEHMLMPGMRRVIFISGEGGIGKTRLLKEIDTVIPADSQAHAKILPIFDFDDDRYKIPQNIEFSIAQHLSSDVFRPYLEAASQLRQVEENPQVQHFITRRSLEITRRFVECFNTFSLQQRVFIRIDTTDAVRDTLSIGYLFDIIAQLHNVCLLIAGRDTGELYHKYGRSPGTDAIVVPLEPFTIEHSRKYLVEKQEIFKEVTFAQAWADKLFLLAGGLPVLIDLAIEWTRHHRPLAWMDQHDLETLYALERKAQERDPQAIQTLHELRENFKKAVVMPVADLASDDDYLYFILAKVNPLDVEGVAEMLNRSQNVAQELVKRAMQSVSIKVLPDNRVKLHDEVERLINDYVWKLLDPNGEWEIRDRKRAIAYFTRKSQSLRVEIARLKQQEQAVGDQVEPTKLLETFSQRHVHEEKYWAMQMGILNWQLSIDVQQGAAVFHREFERARIEGSSGSFRKGLLSVIEPFARLEDPEKDVSKRTLAVPACREIQHVIAREETFSGQFRQAAARYAHLRKGMSPESEEDIEIRNGEANAWIRAGRIRDALVLNEQTLELAEKLQSEKWQVKSRLEIGWTQRLSGNLDQALQYYNEALRLAFKYDDEERIALIYASLGYVHAIQQDDKAIYEVEQAIQLWKTLAQQRAENQARLGQCYNTTGEIYLELDKPEEALYYFDLALNIFVREQILEWQSKSRAGRGYACWQQAFAMGDAHQVNTAQQYLREAQRDLEWAYKHSTELDSPIVCNRLGEVYLLQQNYGAADETWKSSLKEAGQVGAASAALQALGNLARLALYYDVPQFPDWQAFEHYYRRDFRRQFQFHDDVTLLGLFYTYLGNLAMKAHQLPKAIQHYERGLPMLASAGSYKPFNLIGQLEFIQQTILPGVPLADVQQLGQTLKDGWLSHKHDVLALSYFHAWMRWS